MARRGLVHSADTSAAVQGSKDSACPALWGDPRRCLTAAMEGAPHRVQRASRSPAMAFVGLTTATHLNKVRIPALIPATISHPPLLTTLEAKSEH